MAMHESARWLQRATDLGVLTPPLAIEGLGSSGEMTLICVEPLSCKPTPFSERR